VKTQSGKKFSQFGQKRILYLGLDPFHYADGADGANGVDRGLITHWPIIRIAPIPFSDPTIQQALADFEIYTHVIMTSKTSVSILCDYLIQHGLNLDLWKKKSTIAVGKITAHQLKRFGITPNTIASDETAEGIIAELEKMPLKQANIFWPHSKKARPVIKDFLKEKKIPFLDCALYDTLYQAPLPHPNLSDYEEIVFTSPSTVEAFKQIFGALPKFARLTAIGPVTQKALDNLT